ncbi:hypothetical protein [Streptomyces prasinosporus]
MHEEEDSLDQVAGKVIGFGLKPGREAAGQQMWKSAEHAKLAV